MAMRFLTRPTRVAAAILAAGTAIAAVACQMDSLPTAPSAQATSALAAGSQVRPGGGDAQGPAPKLDICHTLGNGKFQLINISANAESTHRAHGDARPGESIPGNASLQLDTACHPVSAAPAALLACPCWDTYSGQQLVTAFNAPTIQSKFCADTDDLVMVVADNGAGGILFASSTTNSCNLTLNGQVKMFSGLQPEVGSQCLLEGKTLFPQISSGCQ